MKTKIISILIGMGIMGILVGCGQAIQSAKASENGYLKYCGSQRIDDNNNKQIEVYEDTEHNKIIYVAMYHTYNMGIAVADNTKQK
jgi:hypothetical protein